SPSPEWGDQAVSGAVFWNAVRLSLGGRSPCASNARAAAPATCGDAIDVPEIDSYDPLSIGTVDQIEPPGAPRSGLMLRSAASPYDEKSEMYPPPGTATSTVCDVQVKVAPPESTAATASRPAAMSMKITGIVISTGPSTVGLRRPGTLL